MPVSIIALTISDGGSSAWIWTWNLLQNWQVLLKFGLDPKLPGILAVYFLQRESTVLSNMTHCDVFLWYKYYSNVIKRRISPITGVVKFLPYGGKSVLAKIVLPAKTLSAPSGFYWLALLLLITLRFNLCDCPA